MSEESCFFSFRDAQPGRVRLVCFPSAGGGIAQFTVWRRNLSKEIELLPVCLPGRDRRRSEPAAEQVWDLAREISQQILALPPLPLALLGHSLGGWVAFEVAHRLEAQGYPVQRMFVAASPAPHLPDRHATLLGLSDQELFAEVKKRYGGMEEPLANDPEFVKLIVPMLRADLRMKEAYEYQTRLPLGCPIEGWVGSTDEAVVRGDIAAWRTLTRGGFVEKVFEGGHFFPRTEQATVLAWLERRLLGKSTADT